MDHLSIFLRGMCFSPRLSQTSMPPSTLDSRTVGSGEYVLNERPFRTLIQTVSPPPTFALGAVFVLQLFSFLFFFSPSGNKCFWKV